MFSLNNKISLRQIQALLILDVFGTGVILLPRIVAEYGEQNGWMCLILGLLFALVFIYLMCSVAEKFPDHTFVEYSSKILSKPVGVILTLVFVIKILLTTALELRLFGEIVAVSLLPRTPYWIVAVIMLAVAAYGASKGYETRARLGELLIVVILLPLALVFVLAATQVDYSNLLPVGISDAKNFVLGGYRAAFAFTGFEFCLLIYPYVSRPKAAKKAVMNAALITGGFMLIITLITLARFGPWEIQSRMWPVLEMMDTIDLPGSFFERQGALVMSFWIVSIFAIVNAGLFFVSVQLKDVTRRGPHFLYVCLGAVLIFALSVIPEDVPGTLAFLNIVYFTLGISFFLAVPLLLYVVMKVRGIR